MQTASDVLPDIPLDLSQGDVAFTQKIAALTGGRWHRCLHCKTCAGGCPFSAEMDPMPNGLIRLVQLGLRKEALECPTIWICIGCYTCSGQCPMDIDIAGVMDAVRRTALNEGAMIPETGIYDFHREILRSVSRYGRTHKLEIMMRYKLLRRDFFSDMATGVRMLLKHKLEMLPSRVRNIRDIKKLM